MSLAKRLAQSENGKVDNRITEVRQRVHQQLIDELGPVMFERSMAQSELERAVKSKLQTALTKEKVALSSSDRADLVSSVSDDILGYGPISRYLSDPTVSEIMVNGADQVFVEREGKLERAPVRFIDEGHLRQLIEKIVSEAGRRVDESTPMVDARLPDGSRVNAVVSPLAVGGPFLTIRKFAEDPFGVADLITFGTLTQQSATFLEACVMGRLNIVVSGGTGTGKTTTLNVLSDFIPTTERIVTVEDAKELQLRQEHVLNLECRPANIEGRGAVTIRDLVRNALRMRPDRIVVGECRSGEALDMLQAMNTGHDGSLTTIHANSPRDALSRIETMTMMAGFELPIKAIREQMASALDVIVHLGRLRDGTRRITHITEVQHMEGDVITLQDLFLFDFSMGVDATGRYRGHIKSTGIRPSFNERLTDMGIPLKAELFEVEGFARRRTTGRR
ncbi:MAG TPA: CpaF family protein [Acidimicrobiales bacterium]|nr:CpaF family protein [Acidimicrobiales bacterium]